MTTIFTSVDAKGGLPFVGHVVSLVRNPREFIGQSVSTCPRGEHRRQRRLMQSAFHPNRLTHYAEMVNNEAATVIKAWQDGDALNEIMVGAGKRMLIPPPFDKVPTPGKIRYDRARKRIRAITDQLIADHRAAGVDHQDLMSLPSAGSRHHGGNRRPGLRGTALRPAARDSVVVGRAENSCRCLRKALVRVHEGLPRVQPKNPSCSETWRNPA